MKSTNINGPAAILGDMNSEPNSAPIKYISIDLFNIKRY